MDRLDQIDRIVFATLNRRVVVMEYAGRTPGMRKIHPHVVYQTRAGAVFVDGMQVAGVSSTPHELPAWRAFHLERVKDVTLTEERFEASSQFDLATAKYQYVLVHCCEEESHSDG